MKSIIRFLAAALLVSIAITGGVQSAAADNTRDDKSGRSPSSAEAWDAYPCLPAWYHNGVKRYVQTCPDWAPADSPYGAHTYPVYNLNDYPGKRIGTIYAPGNDWFVCQKQFTDRDPYPVGGYYNNWWAYTMADNGKWGWVPETHFRGGGNNQADRKLAMC